MSSPGSDTCEPDAPPPIKAKRSPWPWLSFLLAALILVNEAQRLDAQNKAHQERMEQIARGKANTILMRYVIAQNDLQLRYLMAHSTDLTKLETQSPSKQRLGGSPKPLPPPPR